MRSIGNIERFLVIGIVVVIGAILAVAIRGADDLNGAYNEKVAKSKTADSKKGALGLRSEAARPNPAPAPKADLGTGDSKSTTNGGAPPVNQDVLDAINRKKDLLAGKDGKTGDGASGAAKPDASKPVPPIDGPVANGLKSSAPAGDETPIPIDEETKVPPAGKSSDAGNPKPEPVTGKPDNGGARVESTPVALEWSYEVQSGDRLERIASALYSDRGMWKEIAAANPSLSDPTRIKVGMKLALPKEPVNTAVVGLSHGASSTVHQHVTVPDHLQPKDDAKGDSAKVANTPATEKSKSGTFKRVTSSDQYQVQRGDTLMAIAATHYGTRSAWRMILDANSDVIPDKDHIKPGITIKLPAE